MALTKFKFVNHEKLKGLNYKGDFYPFDKIDDKLAEELITKTHVLERLPSTEPAPQPALADITEPAPQLALTDNAEQVAGLPEATTPVKKKDE